MGNCFYGALKGTRTPDLLIRSQTLYPAELSAHTFFNATNIITQYFYKIKYFLLFY